MCAVDDLPDLSNEISGDWPLLRFAQRVPCPALTTLSAGSNDQSLPGTHALRVLHLQSTYKLLQNDGDRATAAAAAAAAADAALPAALRRDFANIHARKAVSPPS
ncbi:unnamed protein product [Gongylonema pulchrum]|uniref:Uncharacterized protein n=1 Tax=Gongylonema pulchrum TaxID=637853 RepID=A0A183EPA8_9BILA|nr:unnamed protein product [Gongylonema pulchrum]